MLQKLLKWIGRLFKRKGASSEKIFQYTFSEDVPDKFKRYVIYIIGSKECYWQLVMLCPCGCKTVLHINLLNEYKPNWSYEIDNKHSITLHPSIHRKVDCKSHFFIREGKIVWV